MADPEIPLIIYPQWPYDFCSQGSNTTGTCFAALDCEWGLACKGIHSFSIGRSQDSVQGPERIDLSMKERDDESRSSSSESLSFEEDVPDSSPGLMAPNRKIRLNPLPVVKYYRINSVLFYLVVVGAKNLLD